MAYAIAITDQSPYPDVDSTEAEPGGGPITGLPRRVKGTAIVVPTGTERVRSGAAEVQRLQAELEALRTEDRWVKRARADDQSARGE